MKPITAPYSLILFVSLLLSPVLANAQDKNVDRTWTADEQQVLDAIERLSASTAPGGGGADAYAEVLSKDYSRWTLGSDLTNAKNAWVEGIRDWFDDGWSVPERKTDFLDIRINGDFAFTRRVVRETFAGPNGESSGSSAAIAEVWKRSDTGWLLFLVNVIPLEDA